MISAIVLATTLISTAAFGIQLFRAVGVMEQDAVEALTEAFEADIASDLQYGRVDEKQVREDLSPRY